MTSSTEASRAPSSSRRQLERDPRRGEGPLGAHDPLGDGRLGHEERARDLVGGEPAQEAKRQGGAGLLGEHGVAGEEHEAQEVVPDVVVERGVDIRLATVALELEFARQLLLLALERGGAPEHVDRAMLGRGHEPGGRVVRHA